MKPDNRPGPQAKYSPKVTMAVDWKAMWEAEHELALRFRTETENLACMNTGLRETLELIVRGWDRVKRNQPKAVLRFREWAGDEDTDLMQGIADARNTLFPPMEGT